MQEELNKQKRDAIPLFKPLSWLAKMDFINHLVLFNNVFITVLAETKGGKTSFIQLLKEKLDTQIKTCLFMATPSADTTLLMQKLSYTLSLRENPNEPLDMNLVVKQIVERKTHVLFIVDDAQFLPAVWIKETLVALEQQNRQPYFHVCLFADFSIVSVLKQLAQNDFLNLIHSTELGTLNEPETKTYVFHKRLLKNKAHKIYSEEQLHQLYKITGGCLTKINSQLSSFMPLSQKSPLQGKKTLASIAALFFIGMIGLSWLFLDIKKEKVHTTRISALSSHIVNWESKTNRQWHPLPNRQVLATLNEGNMAQRQEKKTPSVIPALKSAFKTKKQKTKTLPAVYLSYISPINFINTDASVNTYTIQLIASHQLKDIYYFIKHHKLSGHTAISLASNRHDTWYILTMGEYYTFAMATEAQNNLPAELAVFKPWVRSMDNLRPLVG